MKAFAAVLFSFAFATQGVVDVKVDSKFDKKVNFGTLHTYSWAPGIEASRRNVHTMIVAALDAEMAKVGFTTAARADADVTVAYFTVASTYVNVDALQQMQKENRLGPAPTDTVGRLAIIMRDRTSPDPIWSATTLEYLDPDPAKLAATIQKVSARLFETYPGRKPAPGR